LPAADEFLISSAQINEERQVIESNCDTYFGHAGLAEGCSCADTRAHVQFIAQCFFPEEFKHFNFVLNRFAVIISCWKL
jgi:hypothetical protein